MYLNGWLIVFVIAIFGAVYPYVIYPLFLRLLSWLVRRQEICSQQCQVAPFTVIIPAYNEEQVIRSKLLNTLQCAERTGSTYEIIVVSDGSTDRTSEIVREFKGAVKLIDLPQRTGKMSALHAGVSASCYEFLIFTDADVILSNDGILNLIRHFVDPAVGGVGGRYEAQTDESSGLEGESLKSRIDRWVRTHQSKIHSTIGTTGWVWAARRQALFTSTTPIIADDLVLPLEIVHRGYRFLYDGDVIAVSKVSKTICSEFHRKVRLVCGGLEAAFLCRWMFSPRWFPVVGFHFLSWKLGKYLGGVWFLVLFAANAALAANALWARAFLFAQVTFLALAVSSRLLQRCLSPAILRWLNVAWYAVVVNTAPIVAVWKLLSGRQTALWQKNVR